MHSAELDLTTDGAALHPAALTSTDLERFERLVATCAPSGAGTRLVGVPEVASLVGPGTALMEVARGLLGSPASLRAVRATLFDKRPDRNWALGWHQDRTIAVKARCDAPGFGPWSRKDGVDYVEPPFDLLTRMLTVRAHLDPVGPDNAPLLIALGSHRLGRIAAADAAAIAGRSSCMACLAEPGDVWAYATPILHASDAATRPSHRRVLQIDFAVEELPGELMWLGV